MKELNELDGEFTTKEICCGGHGRYAEYGIRELFAVIIIDGERYRYYRCTNLSRDLPWGFEVWKMVNGENKLIAYKGPDSYTKTSLGEFDLIRIPNPEWEKYEALL